MPNFNRTGGGSRFGADRGGDRGDRGARPSFGGRDGGRDGGRPSYQKKSWGERGGFDKEMFDATCAKCGKACQVPFRPVNGRPVFCKDCFTYQDGAGPIQLPRRERERATSNGPVDGAFGPNGGNREVLKKIEELNAKIERLARAVEILTGSGKKSVVKEIDPLEIEVKDISDDVIESEESAEGETETPEKSEKAAKPAKTKKEAKPKAKKPGKKY